MVCRHCTATTLLIPFAVLLAGCDSSDSLKGVPARLEVDIQPSTTAPDGAAFSVQPSVRVVDYRGSPARSAGIQVFATLAGENNGSVWLSHALATTDEMGAAHFDGLAICGSEGTFRLSFHATGLDPVTSQPVTVFPPIEGVALDPSGDMHRDGADLVSATIRVVGGDSLFFGLTWAPGGFIPDTSRASFKLDTDHNPLTGTPGINSTGTVDTDLIGSEFILAIRADGHATNVELWKPDGLAPSGVYSWRTVPSNPNWEFVEDGVEVTLPLSDFGSTEDGLMDFKVTTSRKVEGTGYSGWLDVVPDVGLPPAQMTGGGP